MPVSPWVFTNGEPVGRANYPAFSGWGTLSSVLTRHLSKRPALLGVELLVALSLTVNFYFLVRPTCLPYRDGNAISRSVFCYLSEHVSPETKKLVQLNWKKRLGGPMLSAWLLDVKFKGQKEFDQDGFQDVFGFYHATWLFLLFLLLILYRRDALLIMLGVFGGLMYNLTDSAQPPFYYPWDLPTMFFFTLACLLYDSRRLWLLMAVVWLGGIFKETTLCCALLILLGEHWPLKKRVVGFTVTVLATFATNKLLMILYDVRAPLLAMNDAPRIADIFRNAHVFSNVNLLFSLDLRHVLFANAGSLLIMMLIPWRNRRDVVFKTVILVFIIGQFFCGIFNEFRIWYELLPLGWMMIADAFRKDGRTVEKDPAMNRRTDSFWKGSYWLMLTGLLLLALGALAMAKLHPPPPEEKNGVNRLSIEELISLAPKGDVAAQYNLGGLMKMVSASSETLPRQPTGINGRRNRDTAMHRTVWGCSWQRPGRIMPAPRNGLDRRPPREIRTRNTTSASSTATASGSNRIMKRRSTGSKNPRSKARSRPKGTSAECMSRDRE